MFPCAKLVGRSLLLLTALSAATCVNAQGPKPKWARHSLTAGQSWQLNLPDGQRLDASGLLLTPEGGLLTVNDRGASLYRIAFRNGERAADLVRLPGLFTEAQLAPFSG